MIVVMQPGCRAEHVDHIVTLIREAGLKEHVSVGTDRTIVGVVGDKRGLDLSALESAPLVDRLVPILSPYKLASREVQTERSQVPLGVPLAVCLEACPAIPKAKVGGQRLAVIAGPCSVESETQLMTTAHAVARAGAVGLRGGAFKPRTSPYHFQGLGVEALKLLAKARSQTGLVVVTEVLSAEQVELVAEYADVLQIGTRNMHNFKLLEAVGRTKRTVLLKRGWCASLDEFLLAAEYILSEGNANVILCERGIRTHETHVRNTLPLATVPAVQRLSHLPIIVDPSQGTGHAYLVPAMAKAAVAAGADGLLIEVHPDPEHALTDGAQSITCDAFATLMEELAAVGAAVGRTM